MTITRATIREVACPNCTKVGLARMDHVIRGAKATLAYYCGYCGHQWVLSQGPAEPPKFSPLPKPRTRRFGT